MIVCNCPNCNAGVNGSPYFKKKKIVLRKAPKLLQLYFFLEKKERNEIS